ncbi:MAG: sporulation protein [Defluviitaleaceae bacterium]|nr:sporulation protein [Defluviitaleaceae bacterium]
MAGSVSENLQMLFSKMEEYVSTKTVVGDPVHIGDVILVPLVDVSFGVGAGVNESTDDKKGKDAGGGALGAKLSPSAVIIINNGSVQLVNVKNQESVSRLIDMVPGVLSKLNIGSFFGKKDKNKDEKPGEAKDGLPDERVSESL